MSRIACWTLAALFAGSAAHAAEPLVPAPEGAPLLLEVDGDGVQIYACETKGLGFAWAFKGPEAELFDKQGRQVGTHFAGPTWRVSDGSAVVGEITATVDSPIPGAIPWLLLRTKPHGGSGVLAGVAFVRRTETKGGMRPADGCDAAHRGEHVRIHYTALYQFYGAAKQR
jgi:hypothetical protein